MNTHSSQQGFTLVETLVAITILIVAVTGAYSAAQVGLSSSTFSRDEVTAFYLAQEGIEEVRNIRDENGLTGQDWLAGIAGSTDPCYFGSSCTVDATKPSPLIPCDAGACPVVRIDPVNGYYGYDESWTATPFTRMISLTQVSSDEVAITVTVSWSKGAVPRSFRVRENIMNWQ